jgi:hypothetical protein
MTGFRRNIYVKMKTAEDAKDAGISSYFFSTLRPLRPLWFWFAYALCSSVDGEETWGQTGRSTVFTPKMGVSHKSKVHCHG